MTKKVKKDSSDILTEVIVKGMEEKKAENIVVLNLKKIKNAICDYFVICEGSSNTHVDAIADSIIEEVRKTLNEKPYHKEGFENAEWILLDYVNVVAHVFQPEKRAFYNLEDLWADAETINYN
ncbi:MAG: ribosome silencing factor [Vicingaceae bacterium]